MTVPNSLRQWSAAIIICFIDISTFFYQQFDDFGMPVTSNLTQRIPFIDIGTMCYQ